MSKKQPAPSVTNEDVSAAIVKTEFVLLPDGRTTICILTLDNGFTIRGESSCVCKENYRQDLGEEYSRIDARNKVWAFLGFRLADQIHQGKLRKGRGVRYRDAKSGFYVTKLYAQNHPDTTVSER